MRNFLQRLSLWLPAYSLEILHETQALLLPRTGLTSIRRDQEVIVSLTTIPERIGKIHLCIETLLRQSVKPNRLILWLSESLDPTRPIVSSKALPYKLRRLQERGLDIRWCKDIRSYRKIIPTLTLFPNAIVVTADDDVFYPRHWLKQLYNAYLEEPHLIHCHRAHLMRYDSFGGLLPYLQWSLTAPGLVGPSLHLFPTGVGGVLYTRKLLHPEVFNEAAFSQLCPLADDIWLKAMSLLMGVACKKVKADPIAYVEVRIPNNVALSQSNLNHNKNDIQLRNVSSRYQVFRPESNKSPYLNYMQS